MRGSIFAKNAWSSDITALYKQLKELEAKSSCVGFALGEYKRSLEEIKAELKGRVDLLGAADHSIPGDILHIIKEVRSW